MKWLLISEAYTPSDLDDIENSFNGDVSDEKYTPTKKFLKNGYDMLNEKLFNNRLPSDFEFKIEHGLKDNAAGHTYANDNKKEGEFVIDGVSLNGTLMMTIHSWLETILHEMIHVMDFKFHPEHFVDARKTGVPYDEHKGWFMKQANKFKNKGFNVEKTLKSSWETSVDDDDIKVKNSSFTYLKISHHPLGWDEILKIDSSDKSNVMSILKNKKYTHVVEIKTSNLNSVRLDNTKVEANKPIMSYHADDEFNDRYGPFEKVEDIDLTKMTFNESGKSELRSTMRIIKLPNGGLQYIT